MFPLLMNERPCLGHGAMSPSLSPHRHWQCAHKHMHILTLLVRPPSPRRRAQTAGGLMVRSRLEICIDLPLCVRNMSSMFDEFCDNHQKFGFIFLFDWLFDIFRPKPCDLKPFLHIKQAPVGQGGAEKIRPQTRENGPCRPHGERCPPQPPVLPMAIYF